MTSSEEFAQRVGRYGLSSSTPRLSFTSQQGMEAEFINTFGNSAEVARLESWSARLDAAVLAWGEVQELQRRLLALNESLFKGSERAKELGLLLGSTGSIDLAPEESWEQVAERMLTALGAGERSIPSVGSAVAIGRASTDPVAAVRLVSHLLEVRSVAWGRLQECEVKLQALAWAVLERVEAGGYRGEGMLADFAEQVYGLRIQLDT